MTSNQKKTLDRLWQQKVVEGKVCSCCRQRMATEGHHVFKRRYLNTRWLIENGRALCHGCHVWAESHPQAYEDSILSEMGEIEYGRLRDRALMVRKQFYDEVKESLNNA